MIPTAVPSSSKSLETPQREEICSIYRIEKMEEQLHNRRHYEEDDPHEKTQHSEVIGDDHREKKSVMEKVKDQAKKIKETIKKSERGHRRDDGDEEDMANPSEVHQGAVPMYESPVVPGTHLPIQTDMNLENPTDTREDRYSPNVRNEVVGNEGVVPAAGPVKMEPDMGRSSLEPKFEKSPELPDTTSVVRISPLMGLEEDPHSPKVPPGKVSPSNYQSKVTDPTGEGGKEADVAPLLQRLDNIHIHDRSQSDQAPPEPKPHGGSHDQFAPQPNPTADQFVPQTNPDSIKTFDQTDPGQSVPRDTLVGKLSSAVSTVAGKAVSAEATFASKLGYRNVSSDKKPELAAERDSERRGGGGGGDTDTAEAAKGTKRGVSVKEYLSEKLRPGEQDKALSDAITERFQKKNVRAVGAADAAARLGTGRGSEEEGEAGGGARSGGGGAGSLKGAMRSWFGKRSGGSESKEEIGGQQQPRIEGSGDDQ
ncbi:hypothetical protein OROHE_009859 [Orobanche hederae]